MRRRHIVIATGIVVVVFGLGIWLGSRIGASPKSSPYAVFGIAPSASADRAPAAATGDPPLACVDIRNAGPLVGKRGCVAGLVVRAFPARSGNTFLDFCQDYRSCPFTSVIFASDRDKFGDLQSLQGRRVEIRGDVISYQDHAEIIIRDPQQVRSSP